MHRDRRCHRRLVGIRVARTRLECSTDDGREENCAPRVALTASMAVLVLEEGEGI